jgi:hypothetical protein
MTSSLPRRHIKKNRNKDLPNLSSLQIEIPSKV